VVISAGLSRLELLDEVRHVVGQAEKVLLIGAGSYLARDRNLFGGVVVTRAAQTFDAEHVLARDAVVEYDAAVDFEVVSSLRDILRGNIGVVAAGQDNSGNQGEENTGFHSNS